MLLCSSDFDLESMTLIYALDPDIMKMYMHTKNELCRSRFFQVTDRQTHGRVRLKTLRRHIRDSRVMIIIIVIVVVVVTVIIIKFV